MLNELTRQLSGCTGVSDLGDGQYMVFFSDGSSRAVTQLEVIEASRVLRLFEINAEATRRILQAYPLEKQSSANMGIYPQVYADKMIADIAAVIAASNTACDAVDAAVDVSGVDAVVVNWPVIGA